MATHTIKVHISWLTDQYVSFTNINFGGELTKGSSVTVSGTTPFAIKDMPNFEFAQADFTPVASTNTPILSGSSFSATLKITEAGASQLLLYFHPLTPDIAGHFINVTVTTGGTGSSSGSGSDTGSGSGSGGSPSKDVSKLNFNSSVYWARHADQHLVSKLDEHSYMSSLSFIGASSDKLADFSNLNQDPNSGTVIAYDFGLDSQASEANFNNIMRPINRMYGNRISNSTMMHTDTNYAFHNTSRSAKVNPNTGSYTVSHPSNWSFYYCNFFTPYNNNMNDYDAYYSFWFMPTSSPAYGDQVSIWLGGPNDYGGGVQGYIDVSSYSQNHWYYVMGKFASKMLANIQTSNTTCTSAISFSNNLTGYSSDHSLTFIHRGDPDFGNNLTTVGCGQFIMPSGVY